MARQEVIDGPGVAAKILSRFPAEEREHLVATIRAEAPKVAATLERRMVDLSKVERLPAPDLQNLLRQVPERDLALSLRATEEPIRQRIIENLSETKLEVVREESAVLPSTEASDIEAAQARILKRLEELYPEDTLSNPRKPFTSRLA
ncbi:MAG: FliG C-terminal domain [Pseudomonadota bacterium]|jgi:flagellar motor switch protein FliG